MLQTLTIVGIVYLGTLIFLARRARSQEKDSKEYLMAGSNIGAFLGLFTFAATLFSTFTLLGMPDFFRTHGIGAWVFLMISDAVMVFGIIWIGYALRKKARQGEYFGMAGFLQQAYQSRMAGIIAFGGAFIFLIPYVAIQIGGVARFLASAFPESVPFWVWAVGIVVVMLVYSEIGGLKAIIYSDTLQGILLLIAIWIIGFSCLKHFGGLKAMFDQVAVSNEALLSVPGPKGLFTVQFLVASLVAIVLLPYTQPQVSTRLVIMKDVKSLHRMAVGLGVFAFLIILPTAFMGMYGAVLYPDLSAPDFWNATYVADQSNIIGALVMIGLIAAAISTSDSQLFALGGEIRSILKGEDQKLVKVARIGIVIFAVFALIFALVSSDQLVSLARTSFAGTSLMAPMIFVGIFYDRAEELKLLPLLTLVGILVFVGSIFKLIPDIIMGIRMDLFLMMALASVAILLIVLNKGDRGSS